MTTTELLKQFADPGVIHAMPLADKMLGGLITTLLGMGITFIALIILQFIISWMDRLINKTASRPAEQPAIAVPEPGFAASATLHDDKELVAVIATAIAMNLKTSVGNIVIRNIEKVDDRSSAWSKAGIFEQMNSRL